ncbi:uncharacterized protein LOC104583190 [Brachypodium distachyon]|uniref:uncharacterized protein LOC104583190 n=1 Tax=Brachypodium distachyon TaxID=15368 RepID=UPI000D0D618B|nr:uncharacterized protein LOC104583190 [Brachypodium distachyon]|eukprot:XP_024314102.1 uncharacterized protein LOC104583190 [Brachypodium distachyon]
MVSLADQFEGKIPNALDLFMLCHNSKQKGFSTCAKDAIGDKEQKLVGPRANGESRNASWVVSEVLLKRIVKPRFLQNVGVEPKPVRTTAKILAAEVHRIQEENVQLRDVSNRQHKQIAELTRLLAENNKAAPRH